MAGLGKLSTFATNSFISSANITNTVAQGLVVATVGGLVSTLAGGSFELGFVTAGLAFAVNEVANRLSQSGYKSRKAARDAARVKAKEMASSLRSDRNWGVNIWRNDGDKTYAISFPSVGKAIPYLRFRGGSADGLGGEYSDRVLDGHSLAEIHVYQPRFSNASLFSGDIARLSSLNVDVSVFTVHPAGGTVVFHLSRGSDEWSYNRCVIATDPC